LRQSGEKIIKALKKENRFEEKVRGVKEAGFSGCNGNRNSTLSLVAKF
jgi:hypothetical protein